MRYGIDDATPAAGWPASVSVINTLRRLAGSVSRVTTYRLGTDELLVDARGDSTISM